DSRLYKYPLAGGSRIEIAGASAGLDTPYGLAYDGNYVYVANLGRSEIRRIDVASGQAIVIASGLADGPLDVEVVDNDLYFTVSGKAAIYKVAKDGSAAPTVVYGSELELGHQDNTGTAARFNQPHDLTYDGAGNIFVADYGGHVIRRIRLATQRVT